MTMTCDKHAEQQLLSDECAWCKLGRIVALVNEQAEDEGLWFRAATAPEAYLQQELRKLHAAIEGTK